MERKKKKNRENVADWWNRIDRPSKKKKERLLRELLALWFFKWMLSARLIQTPEKIS